MSKIYDKHDRTQKMFSLSCSMAIMEIFVNLANFTMFEGVF